MKFIVYFLAVSVTFLTLRAELSAHPLTKLSSKDVADLLKTEGYSASLASDKIVVWMIDGRKTGILFGGGDANDKFFFYTAIKNTTANLERVNKWNSSHNFSNTYIDEHGALVLRLDFELTGGVERARVTDWFKTCKASLSLWEAEFSPP